MTNTNASNPARRSDNRGQHEPDMKERFLKDYVYPNILTSVCHPICFARTLMQLGYEPDPPFLAHTWKSILGLGSKQYRYPTVIYYWKSLSEDCGILGLFTTGLPARLIYTNINYFASDFMLRKFNNGVLKKQHVDIDAREGDFLIQMWQVTASRIVGIILGYPFHLIMVRQMAEVVDDCTCYNTIVSSVCEIWKGEGIKGFYSGVMPRIAEDVITIWVSFGLAYLASKYIFKQAAAPDIKAQIPHFTRMFSGFFAYKYQVVSTNMAVSNSRLQLAFPFLDFIDCYDYLREKEAFSRGSSLVRRFIHGPV